MGLCGEIAYQRLTELDGNSSYRNYIIDAMCRLTHPAADLACRQVLLAHMDAVRPAGDGDFHVVIYKEGDAIPAAQGAQLLRFLKEGRFVHPLWPSAASTGATSSSWPAAAWTAWLWCRPFSRRRTLRGIYNEGDDIPAAQGTQRLRLLEEGRFVQFLIRGAIFDVDGTLLDSMFIWDTIGEAYLRSIGVKISPKQDSTPHRSRAASTR